MSATNLRPWYLRDSVVDEYKQSLSIGGGQFPMLKKLKILRAIVVNIGVLAVGLYGMSLGGDPTILSVVTLSVIGAYNGLEIGDYLALLRAYQEIESAGQDSDE